MVTLEFYDPSGTLEMTHQHAPRLASLEGRRIGFVSNEQWQAYRMLPMLKELLEAVFPGVMKNAASGLGLAPDAAMVTFRIDMFLPGSVAPESARFRIGGLSFAPSTLR